MNRLLSISILFFIFTSVVFAQDTIVLEGHFFEKNLFVSNPSVTDTSFCVQKVIVNNQLTKDEIHSNSFEVDFSLLNIENGDAVKILIIYKSDCKVKVINPEVLQPQSTFSFVSSKVDKSGRLIWNVKGDLYSPLTIEHFRWKKWITAGEVSISDTVRKNAYTFEIKPHFGQNMFRIAHTDENGNTTYSKVIKYRPATTKEIFLASLKVTDNINFTGETAYEIFDEKGNFIIDGFGTQVNVEKLPKGKYWVNYDNKTEMVSKK